MIMTAHRIRIGLAAAMAAALSLAACGGADQQVGAYEKPEDRAMGDPNAPVTVIEYASVTCPYCKAWHDTVWDDFKEQLVETGQVRFVYRDMLTSPADVSMAGALIARAAPEERYFAVMDALFDRQDQILASTDRRTELWNIARAAGMSEDEFQQCLRDENEIARIYAWIEEAGDVYGVTHTPSFVVNGVTHQGLVPLSVFEEAVAEAARNADADAEG